MARILIIDDNETMREGLGATVRRMGHEAVLASSGAAGLAQVAPGGGRPGVDFVITDLKMEGTGGLEVVKAVRERDPDCPVMIVTAFGTVETAVEAMRLGAFDFLQKPFAPEVVRLKVARAIELRDERRALERAQAENAALRADAAAPYRFDEIVGETPAMQAVFQTIEKVAPTDASVYIHGESGTGKELVARAIHARSKRASGPFVKVNCGALTETLLESELFGHEKGAFTGAVSQKVGRFELAHQGSLFLDEVGDIPPELQPKLLRVLQEQEFERLGGTRTIKVDVRLVAATHRDLTKMVADGRFREDLYYRLNVFPVVLPPLRERPDDIPRLVRHFTQLFARRMGRRIETIPSAVMDALVRYQWPGNVRELQNVIERAVILSTGPSLQVPPGDLQSAAMQASPPTAAAVTLADAEREHILAALRETGWVVGGPEGAASRLGMKRSTLYKKMKKLGISRLE